MQLFHYSILSPRPQRTHKPYDFASASISRGLTFRISPRFVIGALCMYVSLHACQRSYKAKAACIGNIQEGNWDCAIVYGKKEKCICILLHAIPHLLNIPGETRPSTYMHGKRERERERERERGSVGGNMYISRYLAGEKAIRKRGRIRRLSRFRS